MHYWKAKILMAALIWAISVFPQPQFSFDMIFEDALGNKDTLFLGFDEYATEFVDDGFGEEDITELPP